MRRALARPSQALALGLLVLGIATPAQADHGDWQHWDRNLPTVTPVARIFFADHAANWPVPTQVNGAWNDTPNYIKVGYRTAGNCNNATLNCIPVLNVSVAGSQPGWTEYEMVGETDHFRRNSVRVKLNDAWSYGAGAKREVTCHELGHAVGPLDHSPDDASCMKPLAPFVDTSTVHDRNTVRAVYNH